MTAKHTREPDEPAGGPTPLEHGLATDLAERSLASAGANELSSRPATPRWRLLLAQFESPLVLILVAAALISAALGDLPDAVAITVIVALNAVIGFVQERRAEQAMAALRSMTAPRAVVRRDGELRSIPAREVVVGDLLVLEAGDVVAADARVRSSHGLACNEAPLTGESLPVDKWSAPVAEDAPLAERSDRVFMGTSVAGGTGVAEVLATGMATQIGRIASMLDEAGDDATPLQRRLDRVGKLLLLVCIGLVAVVAVLGWARGMSAHELFLSAVSMAVAAVPEGMPAIITIALALGMQRMAARKLLVRRLAAVETLGSVTVICTDKTGTLTTGVMRGRELWGPDERALLWAAAACCDAELGPPRAEAAGSASDDSSDSGDSGDSTELALLHAARERGIERAAIETEFPTVAVTPFSPQRRRMSVHRSDGRLWVKGGVEVIAERLRDQGAGPDPSAESLLAEAEAMAARGLRVLAVAVGEGPEEQQLRAVGLIGLADPPRAAAKQAIAAARRAGVRTVMITGDHPVTAHAIARELELVASDAGPSQLAAQVRARATAEDKTVIVRELRAGGEVVAMTGDGVNDAPAIREADVGLAMGETATEVTREASDIVLVDDDLGSVLSAIREGRVIYDNIQKTVVYLLSGNFSELVIMLIAAAMGLPFPLLPLHLLWINLMTEPLPGLALVIDPPERDVLEHPPRDPGEALLRRREWGVIVATALLQTVVGFGVYWWALELDGRSVTEARSLVFSTVVCSELLRSFAFRSYDKLLWQVGALRNLGLVIIVGVSLAMQLALFQLPFTRELFELAPLAWADLGLALAIAFIPVSVLELLKLAAALWRRTRRADG